MSVVGGAEQRPRQAESEEVSCKFDGLLLPGGLKTKPDTYQAVLNCYVAVLKTPLLMVHPSLGRQDRYWDEPVNLNNNVNRR